MVKLQATQDFTLNDFNKIKIIKRKNKDEKGWVYNEDILECGEDMANYLTGGNSQKLVVAKILEVEQPKEEIKEEPKEIIEEKPRHTLKKKSKRNKLDF